LSYLLPYCKYRSIVFPLLPTTLPPSPKPNPHYHPRHYIQHQSHSLRFTPPTIPVLSLSSIPTILHTPLSSILLILTYPHLLSSSSHLSYLLYPSYPSPLFLLSILLFLSLSSFPPSSPLIPLPPPLYSITSISPIYIH